MVTYKHAGGAARPFRAKDDPHWATKRLDFETFTDEELMSLARTDAKTMKEPALGVLPTESGLRQRRVPKNFRGLRDLLKRDPSWGTYNTADWKLVDAHDLDASTDTKGAYLKAYVAWPSKVTKTPEFLPFRRLAPELRIKIWEHALPDGRDVHMRRKRRSFPIGTQYQLRTNRFDAARGHLACHESWSIFLENYEKIKIKTLPVDHPLNYVQGYFSPKRDTLCVYGPDILAYDITNILDLSRIQHIAIGWYHFSPGHHTHWARIQAVCPQLKSLTIIPRCSWKSRGSSSSARQFRLIEIDDSLQNVASELLDHVDRYYERDSYVDFPDGGYGKDYFFNRFIRSATDIKQMFEHDVSYTKLPGLQFKVSIMMLEETNVQRWWAKRRQLVPGCKMPFEVEFFTYEPITRDPHTIMCIDEAFAPDPITGRITRIFYMKNDNTLVRPDDDVRELFDEGKAIEDSEKQEVGLKRMGYHWKN